MNVAKIQTRLTPAVAMSPIVDMLGYALAHVNARGQLSVERVKTLGGSAGTLLDVGGLL